MFEVRVGDGIWRRNANQLLMYQSQPEELESRVSPNLEVSEDDEVGPETASGWTYLIVWPTLNTVQRQVGSPIVWKIQNQTYLPLTAILRHRPLQ